MKITFPAMKGFIGGRTYYTTQMPLNVVPRVLAFADAELEPQDREQRKLTTKRVPDIANYITENDGEGYLFSAITASHRDGVTFLAAVGLEGIGTLEVDLSKANFLINDGQHRAAAIEMALKQMPSLGEDSITVILFPYENKARAQQMFSDLNRYVKKTSKSIDILFDHRDIVARVTREVANAVPAFTGLVEMEQTSLSAGSKMLFTLAALHDATVELLHNRDSEENTQNELTARAIEYWAAISKVIPEWGRVRRGDISAREFRMENISSHSVVLRALGAVGAELIRDQPHNWKERLEGLRAVDWKKANADWEGVNIVANSVVSNRQARAATKAYIKSHLGMQLTDTEQKAVVRPSSPRAA